ncbi:phosphatidylglycerophosphatase A family protein [Tropicimonas isoalkanivorans]|uniref:Phosphatidylglycerophosphatase A n=1 Tax=Tropicimonas isoalkanivorans TaxID=441112 RepID=A0A1I1DPI5_9RHOB|nr:phosphatidylglycerophosphatase A [Tropicimonas isoalkanivorans]SFB76875.1 phosphatidylglycerophosphatase A [Tropicimonas isoalkanivorans]
MTATRFLATFFCVGLLRPAPGTWGSMAAIPVAYLLHWLGGFPLLLIATAATAAIGWWTIRTELLRGTDPDPSEIVIDEAVGMWIALLPLSAGLWFSGVPSYVFPYPGWLGAFFLFRLFDIWKPGPVGWAERLHGEWGVMLDDMIAGVLAAVAVSVAAFVSHTWFMG